MRRRWWLLLAGLLLGGAAIGWWVQRPPRPETNLLLITLDTTRADRLGAWGGPEGLTPVLDDLAAQSVVFERAYAPVPITLPSHTSLMTGLYPPEHGLRVNSGLNRLGAAVPVLSEQLRNRGYATGAFLGAFVLDRRFGLDRGFDVYDDRMEEAHGPTPGDAHGHKMRIGERVVDAALAWFNARPKKPFFCWVHLFDPHTPYHPRPELFGEKYVDRPYDAGIAYVDRQIGRLLQHLRDNGLDQKTIVVVVGDHGESLDEHGERTHGFTLYDATLHVPAMIHWPGAEAPVRRIAAPISLVDFYPTLLAELAPGTKVECSGRNLLPACHGAELPAVPLYAESNHPFEEIGAAPLRSLVTEKWKYIRSPRRELYDLAGDPEELRNVAADQVDLVKELDGRLQELESSFVLKEPVTMVMGAHERRKLASLGYAGGGATPNVCESQWPDIKDVLPYYYQYTDAQELIGTQRLKEADASLTKVVAAVPNFFQAWYNLGYCRERLGDFEGAEAAYRRAVEIDGNATAQTTLGEFYLSRGQVEQAIPPLEAAVGLQPDLLRALFMLGEAYRRQERWDEARKQYLDVLAADPSFEPARKSLETLPEDG